MKRTILAIGAHPDDIEIGCGGTLAILCDKGFHLFNLIITSGEEGSLQNDKAAFAKQREAEARRSAEAIGAKDVIFLRAPDGLTVFTKEHKTQVISILREVRPEIVFTHSGSDHFPDHAVVHQLSMAAIAASSGPWYPDAGQSPHHVQSIYGYEVWNPMSEFQTAVNIEASLERKIEALKIHGSQTKDINYIAAVRGLAHYRGVMSMTGSAAEVFEVLKAGMPL